MGGYTAQIGAYADHSGALTKARDVERVGFRCEVKRSVREGRTLYVVSVGRFTSWGEANAMASKLRARGFQAIVAP